MGAVIDPDWLRDLEARIDRPPERARAPLRLACAVAATGPMAPLPGAAEDGTAPAASTGTSRLAVPPRIGSIESELALALAGAGVPIVDAGPSWLIEAGGVASPDAILATLAATLRAQARAGAWRDELLAVTDTENDRALGAIERAAVRPLGLTTYAVHLIVHTPDGRIWVQQRAFDKSTDPGRWDTTMGGLIAAGEPMAVALERETWEEAGLRLDALRGLRPFGRFTVRRPVPHGYMVERTELYEAIVADGAVPANQDGEVERFACLARDELVERLHADAFTLEAALGLARWLALGDEASDGR